MSYICIMPYSPYPFNDQQTYVSREPVQDWQPTPNNPYPSTFTQAPASSRQVYVTYGVPNSQPQLMLQGLSPSWGPVAWQQGVTRYEALHSQNPPCYGFRGEQYLPYPKSHATMHPVTRMYMAANRRARSY